MPDIIIVGETCFGSELISPKQGFGDFLVDVNCDTTRPLLMDNLKDIVLQNVDISDFTILKDEDNANYCETEDTDRGGWANPGDAVATFYPSQPHSFQFITDIQFYPVWGVCVDKIIEDYDDPRLIDVLGNQLVTGFRTVFEAKDAILDFVTSTPAKGYGFDGSRRIKYYPMPKTSEHELEHIAQFMDSSIYYYNDALYKINWIEAPPLDYCDINKLAQVMEEMSDNVKDLYNQANTNVEESIKKYREEYERLAYEAGDNYVHNILIPLVKEYINNPY